MSDAIEKLLNLEADKQISADDIVEANSEAVARRAAELLEDPSQRNPYLWDLYEVADQTVTLADYQAVEVTDRDMPWLTEVGAMIAAANMQAIMDTHSIVELLDHAQEHGEMIDAISKDLSPEELRQAAKQGVGKLRREAAKERRANT